MRILSELPLALSLRAAMVMLGLNGCTDPITNPNPARGTAPELRVNAGELGEVTASVRWSAITRDFIAPKPAAEKPNQQAAFRAFAYLSLAQYRASVPAHDSRGRPPHASPRGAASAASAVVLGSLFPNDAGFFE